ncbi:hypothetical protein H5410_030788 [Solanum commersonii]|uniref:Uncharacterized protein n=1 Tax=Solanum commersonii TaxID=4109 RepID=A0A9J5YGL1_SOLCO|nr:hypothetical protein H5410_030788 [Solanum commersonii]
MLKRRLSRFQNQTHCTRKTEELSHIKNSRGHYARLKRKLTLITHKYKYQPIKKIQHLLHFVKSLTNLMKLSNCMLGKMTHQMNVDEYSTPSKLGPPTYNCQYCGAISWYEELTDKGKNTRKPKFTFCCIEGRVQLSLLNQLPIYLKNLLGTDFGQLV